MTDSLSPSPSDEDTIAFIPAPCNRRDGWTAVRQRDFIHQLSRIGLVAAAVQAVGMSKKSVYALRQRKGAEDFAAAWDLALDMGRDHANELAITRAIDGYEVPYFYGGLQRGTYRRYDNRLLLASLAQQARMTREKKRMVDRK